MTTKNTTKKSSSQQVTSHKDFTTDRHAAGVVEYILKSNNLRVLLKEDHTAPAVGVMITYAVGSRDEKKGETGAAHLLEHMMFKGSENFNKAKGNDAWQVLERVGGKINATTWLDRTNYYEVVPKEYIETALLLEADRMRRAILTAEDFKSERTVVLNELERYENEPMEVLDVAIWAESFKEHPYKHPTIGWREDVEKMSIEDLRKFYNTFYFPDNATLSVFGDIDTKEALDLIAKHYGKLPKAPGVVTHDFPEEPEQREERRVTVSRDGAIDIVAVSHKIPSALHGDAPALVLLSHILGTGRRSRLYQALVETNLATEVALLHFPFRDQSLMTAYVFVAPGVAHAKVEKVVVDVFESLAKRGVGKSELESAKAKVASELAFSKDGVYASLQSVGNAVALGEWMWYADFPIKVVAENLQTVRRVATKYFAKQGRTVGYFIAKRSGVKKK